MSIKEIIQQLRVTMDDANGQDSHFDSWLTQNEGICEAIDALKILDAQPAPLPVQKPVAWMCNDFDGDTCELTNHDECENPIPLYTAPPQRPWVGLTDEEIEAIGDRVANEQLVGPVSNFRVRFAQAIEQTLKEKNCG